MPPAFSMWRNSEAQHPCGKSSRLLKRASNLKFSLQAALFQQSVKDDFVAFRDFQAGNMLSLAEPPDGAGKRLSGTGTAPARPVTWPGLGPPRCFPDCRASRAARGSLSRMFSAHRTNRN
jgi:hypothetical protein